MKDTFPDQVGTAASQFGMGGEALTSNISRYVSEADITSDTQLIKSPKASTCLAGLIQTALNRDFAGSGITVGTVQLVISLGPSGAASNIVATSAGMAPVSTPNGPGTIYVNSVYVSGAKLEGEIDFLGTNAPVAATLRTSLGNIVAGRVARA